jgi:SAM-dependent methyltransferase
MDGWKKIWEEREGLSEEFLKENENKEICVYAKLKKLDGFDISVENEEGYKCFLKEFEMMFEIMQKLTLDKGKIRSVYEVGCGSGANLYLFNNRIEGFCGGGIDYSRKQIDTVRTVFAGMDDFTCGEAIELGTEIKYDVVMSESVFQYFSSEAYAKTVVEKMIEKADKLVYIGEICDIVYEEEQMNARRQKIENYDELYKGLGRRFYSRGFFGEIADKHGKNILYTECENEEYINGEYMFNCYIY